MNEHIKHLIEKIEKEVNYKVVYLGMGCTFKATKPFKGWATYLLSDRRPEYNNRWAGHNPSNHYFVAIDSEVARLNGHTSTPINLVTRKLSL